MLRGTQPLRRAWHATALGALVALALTGCGAAAGATSRGGDAPVSAASGSPVSVTTVTHASGAVRGGTRLTVSGSGLGDIRTLVINGTTVRVATDTPTKVTVQMPAAKDFAPGTVPFTLRAADGKPLAQGTFRYRITDGIDRELRYVLTYWKHYNPKYPALGDDDCVDFTSQALLQRGWKQQGDWFHAADVYDSGAAWRSSTAFRDFMEQHPELGTELTDEQRDRVKVGDVVQFDWDRSGDRDHTGVVTRVVKSDGKVRIYFAGHTNDSDFRSVDTAITKDHPGGAVYYWSLK